MTGIFVADLHLTQEKPRCRLDDDWIQFQFGQLKLLVELCNAKKCPLYIMGDIFDKPTNPMQFIISIVRILSHIKCGVNYIAGNHDLLYHSLENIDCSSIGLFDFLSTISDKFKTPDEAWAHYGGPISNEKNSKILMVHELVFENKKDIPHNVKALCASEMLKKYPKYKWIFVGDMHRAFHYTNGKRHIINIGCMNRQSISEKNYKCCSFYINTESNSVIPFSMMDNGKIIDDSYIKDEKEREDRVSAFVQRIKKTKSISLSITKNIEASMNANEKQLGDDTIKYIRTLVQEAQDGGN